MRSSAKVPAPALALFDIDGTLVRKSGPHHRQALVDAVRLVLRRDVSLDHIPLQGMLDRDILMRMLRDYGVTAREAREAMPALVEKAQRLYTRTCPDLRGKVCPGVRGALRRLQREGIPAVLVTGNLSRIGWKKMECAGLREFFAYGAFAESASTRAGLARLAIRHARKQGWIERKSSIALIGDHPNDIAAAKANRVKSIAVATGVVPAEELAEHRPDLLLPDLRSFRVEMLR